MDEFLVSPQLESSTRSTTMMRRFLAAMILCTFSVIAGCNQSAEGPTVVAGTKPAAAPAPDKPASPAPKDVAGKTKQADKVESINANQTQSK